MSQRTIATSVSALMLLSLPAVAIAQDAATDPAPMWAASVKQDAMDVAAFEDGFVLVGGPRKKPNAKIWLSPDGSSWSSVKAGDILDGVALMRVAPYDGGVVALGTQGRKLVALRSADGETWKKTTVDKADKDMELFPQAVTEGPAGIIAVASLIGQDFAGQRWYASADGKSWETIDPPSDTAPGMFVSLESTGDDYLAVARPMYTPTTEVLWRSADGASWETVPGPEGGELHDLAIGADGDFVGVGAMAGEFLPLIWHADELGVWEQVYESPSMKGTEERLDVVAASGSGFLVGGSTSSCPDQTNRYCPSAAVLSSADGVEWEALGVEDGVPGPLHDTAPQSIATNAGTTAVVAWHEDRPMEIWTVPAGE